MVHVNKINCCPRNRLKALMQRSLGSFLGPSMEHQHSTRVTDSAPRIVQGMNILFYIMEANHSEPAQTAFTHNKIP